MDAPKYITKFESAEDGVAAYVTLTPGLNYAVTVVDTDANLTVGTAIHFTLELAVAYAKKCVGLLPRGPVGVAL